ncbi:MAG: hypothetical protein IJN64_18315 [Lachnospiraceae bacterium]|nr:hypothetical protein [Lachnospiraceae bacterium]
MRLPNKVTSYQESVLSKLIVLLDVLCTKDISIIGLYSDTKQCFSDISEFIDTVDVLFALNKIEYNENLGVLHYVG